MAIAMKKLPTESPPPGIAAQHVSTAAVAAVRFVRTGVGPGRCRAGRRKRPRIRTQEKKAYWCGDGQNSTFHSARQRRWSVFYPSWAICQIWIKAGQIQKGRLSALFLCCTNYITSKGVLSIRKISYGQEAEHMIHWQGAPTRRVTWVRVGSCRTGITLCAVEKGGPIELLFLMCADFVL